MKMYYRSLGSGQPIVMLHGIFGSSDNWLTQARKLSSRYQTFALDLRNHGQSPHDDTFDYPSMVGDLLQFIEDHDVHNAVLVGHSMGGKVAMNFAVAYPDKIQRLIVVDIAPRQYNMENYEVLTGLNAVPIEKVGSRQEADDALARHVGESDVRQFLLKNLQRQPEGGYKWKLNLPSITKNIEKIGLPLQFDGKFDKPALFVRGARSNYVRDEDFETILEIFPKAEFKTLDTGHWVPAEKPEEFVSLVSSWLEGKAKPDEGASG